VRYENLSLTLAICIVLVSLKRWRTAIGIFAIAVTPLLLFALFLKVHGLPGLPTSVLVKGDVYTASTPLGKLIHIVQSNLLLGGHELLQRTGLISLSLASLFSLSLRGREFDGPYSPAPRSSEYWSSPSDAMAGSTDTRCTPSYL